MTWKPFVLELVTQLCDKNESRSFTLNQLLDFSWEALGQFAPKNNNRVAKVRQQLQFLRNDQLIAFVDGRGTYTLLGQTLLVQEIEAEALPILQAFQGAPEKREYLIEIYARDKGLVKQARELFEFKCACFGCSNSFVKNDGTFYCEVHHITPFYQGGEDVLSNLSVLCAHHHRMAHFASFKEQEVLREFLLDRTTKMLAGTTFLLSVPHP